MVEVIGACRVERAQLRQCGSDCHASGDPQHHHHGVQSFQRALLEHGKAGGLGSRQGRRGGRPGQDFLPHHRFAARARFEHVAVLPQQAAHLDLAQRLHAGHLAHHRQAAQRLAQEIATHLSQPGGRQVDGRQSNLRGRCAACQGESEH